MNKESRYILKRKIKAFFESLPFYAFRVFPINKNKVVMWTFECGGGYGCSPKYIAEELIRRNKTGKTNYEIVWLVNDISKEFPSEITKVKNTLLNRAYHLATAKFWVANTRTFYGTKKRKQTKYLQTWHGTLNIKPIGKYRGVKIPYIAKIISEYDSNMIDFVFSGSNWCTQTWRDGLIYDGTILETGTPRCDILFNSVNIKHKQLRMLYNLPNDCKIMLYAPTFRGGSQSTTRSVNTEVCSVDFERLINALERRFKANWYIFLRLHPQLATQIKNMPIAKNFDRLVDVSQAPDMNELIAASDAFLTDYSSAIFESFLMKMPSFIYADDLKEYIADRGELMFNMDELPFPLAYDNDDLEKNILSFDKEEYNKKVDDFIIKVGIIEDGHASERVADLMEQKGEQIEKSHYIWNI